MKVIITNVVGAALCALLFYVGKNYKNGKVTAPIQQHQLSRRAVKNTGDEQQHDPLAEQTLTDDDIPKYSKDDEKALTHDPYIIPDETRQLMKDKGMLLITFKKPYFLDVLDPDTTDLVWTTEAAFKSNHTQENFWDKFTFTLEVQRENEETRMIIENIPVVGRRRHGRYRIPDPRPGSYFVVVDGYVPSPDGTTFAKVAHGRQFFLVQMYRRSMRLTQFSFGIYKDNELKKLDQTRQKPGDHLICFTPVAEAEFYRIYIYEIEKGNFYRKVILYDQLGTEIGHPPAPVAPVVSSRKRMAWRENEPWNGNQTMEKTRKWFGKNKKQQGDPFPTGAATGYKKLSCMQYYFFKHNDTIRPSFVFISGTAWKIEGGTEVMVGWSRTIVFGYWNKFIKNVVMSILIAGIFAAYVCAYIKLGAFAVWSTAATKLFVFAKVQYVLWGGDEQCFWGG